MNKYTDILLTRNPVILVRSVVRGRTIDSNDPPRCVVSENHDKFSDRHGNELFGSSEVTEIHSTTTMSSDIIDDKIEDLHPVNHSMSCKKQTLPESLPHGNSILGNARPQSFPFLLFSFQRSMGVTRVFHLF